MKKISATLFLMLGAYAAFAQEQVSTYTETPKLIPDKVFEIGLPLLFLFIILNTLVEHLKNRAEHQLKLKMIDKGISEESLIKIFKESNAIRRLQPLKWFLFSLSIGVALIVTYSLKDYVIASSGYIPTAIILLFMATAFLAYYRILSKNS